MSDPPKSKPSIPSWQRPAPSSKPEDPSGLERPATQQQESEVAEVSNSPFAVGVEESTTERLKDSTDGVSDQVRKFLEEPSIQSAPKDKKIEFLKSKGVSEEDIGKLIGSSENQNAVRSESPATNTVWTHRQLPQTRSAPDVPPIITYPEFLMHSQKPPPLITARRLLYTAYFTGGLVAAFYGLSRYIVGPMIDSLTDARHDLAVHTQAHIRELNERLSKIVSEVSLANKASSVDDPDAASDISSIEEDPTEFYHRDFGTQTSPNLSRRQSATDKGDVVEAAGQTGLATGHQKRLEIIHSHITDLLEDGKREDGTIEDSKNTVKDLGHYLDTLTYPALNYSNYNYDSMYGSDHSMKNTKDDAIDAVKKEIRGVKGVLLSARNFPGTARMIARVNAA